MKRFTQKPVRLDEKELKTDLGENNYIFIGSSVDMFAPNIPDEWIIEVIEKTKMHPFNKYLFQLNEHRFIQAI